MNNKKEIKEFISWLDTVVEHMMETDKFNKNIEFKLDGKSLKLPLNADMYEAVREVLKEEYNY